MSKENAPVSHQVVMVLLYLLAIVPSVLLTGYTITVLWGWFITPQFGLAVPSMVNSLGIALLIGYITSNYTYAEDNRDPYTIFASTMVRAFLRPVYFLLFGWILLHYR